MRISEPKFAVLDLPIELEHLNAADLPDALAEQGESLAPLPTPDAALDPNSCSSFVIPGPVKQFEAVLLIATLTFEGGDPDNRLVLFAQKVGKDASTANASGFPIPAVSQWGLAMVTLLLLVAAKIYFGRQRSAATQA